MRIPPLLAWIAVGLLGLTLAAGVTYAATQLSSQRIGLSAEPLSAGEELAPRPARTQTTPPARTRPRTTPQTTTPRATTPRPRTTATSSAPPQPAAAPPATTETRGADKRKHRSDRHEREDAHGKDD